MSDTDVMSCYASKEDLISSLKSRCAELENKLERYQSGDIHTCHDQCEWPICVLRRKADWMESMLERAKLIMTYHTPDYDQHDWLADLERGPQ